MLKLKFSLFLILSLFLFSKIFSQENIEELREHVDSVCQEPDHKHFNKLTLGYITPWQQTGLDLALKYSAKFDILSPCWFDIKPESHQGKFNTKLDGANYVNTGFMSELKERKPDIIILPRFRCEGFTAEQYSEWLKEANADQFIRILIRRLKYNKFNGMVLECTSLFVSEETYSNFALLIKKLYETLKKEKMSLVLVLLPYSENIMNILTKNRFEYLSKYVDYFNVMTYDYVSYKSGTNPTNNRNAPISWIEKTLELYIDYSKPTKEVLLRKILLGLPFHGVLIESSKEQPRMSILDSNAFTNLVSSGQVSDLHWDEKESEHLVTLENEGSKSLALYPTKKFIKERIEFCKIKNLGGIAIWELSLGLESFLDEF